uniref:Deoxyribonuclease TATDN1 n=1 Tax=Panagrellus redivivus TaxID=6233 RepID=A0A7E4WBL7_PANRE
MLKSVIRAMVTVPYELVDIGANLGHPSYKNDFEKVLERAKQAGLSKIMITGTSEKLSQEAAALVKPYPGFLYFTAGVHPHDAKDYKESTEGVLRELVKDPQCVAVGECGLDFNRNFSPPEVQKEVFEKQVGLAVELQKPLFIHEREGAADMLSILGKFEGKLPKVVIHCFTGTAEEAKTYISKGFYIGLTGFLWKDRSPDGVKFALQNGHIPLDRLVLETDAPYMYPKVNDKKIPAEIRNALTPEALALHKHSSFNRNEPCSLAAICELVAGFMGVSATEVATQTTANAKLIYGLD